jgi:hypothetical protein
MGPKIAAIVIAGLLLAGCTTSVGLTSSVCDPRSGINAIRLSEAERQALSTGVKRDILVVNKFLEKNCGWKP